MEEKILSIKKKIFDKIEESLSGNVLAMDLNAYYNIINMEESKPDVFYGDMVNLLKMKTEKQNVVPENS